MIGDMSSNPVAYATDRMALINHTFDELKQKSLTDGNSYQQLLISTNVLYGQYKRQAEIISRQIGGVYVERHFINNNSANRQTKIQPYTPVPKATQKAAMDALAQYVFAPDTLAAIKPLYTHLQHQRRGFSHYGKNEDPKAHKMVLNVQVSVLNQLLHANVLQRISDTSLYGNEYDLTTYMKDLTAAIFIDEKS
ncbi:protein of unknown function [Pseudoalteromonas denitrificans DSM 6059]|uniref:EcxA zinc-binding domain-containing protein n=1 Tax=Pseudoalteromonas denitrificans DSM 6059 TaxID=1123010 RepID=A0A1I1PZR8_9GAMM|nr:protein of unknown function [Pseudoalteromonas denitrificans DSM 6059]